MGSTAARAWDPPPSCGEHDAGSLHLPPSPPRWASDAPLSGPDDDCVVQTFFTIDSLKAPMVDDSAE